MTRPRGRRGTAALSKLLLLLTAAFPLLGCRPEEGPTAALIDGPRLLAVRADPAEARPGETVRLRAFLATPGGPVEEATVDWAFCRTPKPLAENSAVAAGCLDDHADDADEAGRLAPIAATSLEAEAVLPDDGCNLFGPELPPQLPGQPPQRPRDADPTGGYFQPVRLRWDATLGVALQRLRCNLADAGVDVAREFNERYTPNLNPTLDPLRLPARVAPGETVELTASWSEGSAETFVVHDRAAGRLVPRREALRVSWFATGGRFATDVTGRADSDARTDSTNGWTAPTSPGRVHLWVVLRDSRGGVDVGGAWLTVR